MANDEGKPKRPDKEWIEWAKKGRPTPYQMQLRNMLERVPPRSPVEQWMMEELGYIVRRAYVLKSNPGDAESMLVSDMTADAATCERVLLMYRAYFHSHPPADPIEIKEAYIDALALMGERAWEVEQKQREKLEQMPTPEQVM